jgi:chemotaxis protein CheX
MSSASAEKLPFRFVTRGASLIVHVQEENDRDLALAFSHTLSSIVSAEKAHLIIECGREFTLSQPLIRSLMQLRHSLQGFGKQMRLIGLSDESVAELKAQGLEHALKASGSVQEAEDEIAKLKTTRTLDAKFIDPFLTSSLKVLELQAATKATPGSPFRKEVGEKLHGDISGVIGLVADAFTGSVVISFPELTFLKIMSRMLGEEFTKLTSEIQDGAGELTNIIFGQAKVVLNEQGYNIQTALPSVIVGSDHSVITTGRTPRIVVPFNSDAGPFFIEICLSV